MDDKRFINLNRKCDLVFQYCLLFIFYFIIHFQRTIVIEPTLPYRDNLGILCEFSVGSRVKPFVLLTIRMKADGSEKVLVSFREFNRLPRGLKVTTDDDSRDSLRFHS